MIHPDVYILFDHSTIIKKISGNKNIISSHFAYGESKRVKLNALIKTAKTYKFMRWVSMTCLSAPRNHNSCIAELAHLRLSKGKNTGTYW